MTQRLRAGLGMRTNGRTRRRAMGAMAGPRRVGTLPLGWVPGRVRTATGSGRSAAARRWRRERRAAGAGSGDTEFGEGAIHLGDHLLVAIGPVGRAQHDAEQPMAAALGRGNQVVSGVAAYSPA